MILEGLFIDFPAQNLPNSPDSLFMEWLNIAIEKEFMSQIR